MQGRGNGLPVVILGGSDRRAARLPEPGRDKHPLSGYKGAEILIQGRPLIEILVQRFEGCDGFGPVYLAGPAAVYASLRCPVRPIDTDGTFGDNIRCAVETLTVEQPGRPIVFTTCDILPTPETLHELLARYRSEAPCDLWSPMVREPADRRRLGASSWKPAYRIVPERGQPPVGVLPGHLVVVDPQALRVEFLYRLFQAGYRTRNRPILHRLRRMLPELVLVLLRRDLRGLLSGRLPTLTWTVVGAGVPAALRLRAGTITREQLEEALRRMFVRRSHRRAHPGRRVSTPIVDALSLALDIDTEEEAHQHGGAVTATRPA